MPIDYKLSKLVINSFRGINKLELVFRDRFPSVLIGSNNAGKSTVLDAIALALNGGGSHQWAFSEADFFCDEQGSRSNEFLIQLHFQSDNEDGYPAVKGVGKPVLIHGVQVKGTTRKDGRIVISKTLLDRDGKPITVATRTPLADSEKKRWAEHDVNYRVVNARLADIYEHTPEVWLFKPQDIEASLYIWKTGPIAKLSKLLANKFLSEEWVMARGDGENKRMPATLYKVHAFFREAVEAFPFWKNDMKPRLQRVFSRYVGSHARIDLRPDTQVIEDWLAQQLAISLATDPNSVTMPLRSMGDGWQSVIRLASLEALAEYPDIVRDRVVLLLEEPETHLHPHLRRKIRGVLGELSAKGWTVVYTTHSSELVSFDANQVITRMVRTNGAVVARSVHTDNLETDAKLQSKLDERGAHDFLFGAGVIFCEGKDDSFAVRVGFEQSGADCDARAISVTQCGSVTGIPAFAQISTALGIRWCAITDEDLEFDGTIKPVTFKVRERIEQHRGSGDKQLQWAINLEHCLGVDNGKATPEVSLLKLSQPEWQANHPQFNSALAAMALWIDPALEF
jgi:ABC-type cobalamin transport system ATPase subunit